MLWARTVVLSRGFTLLLEGKHEVTLVPLFDLLDHSPSARFVLYIQRAQPAISSLKNLSSDWSAQPALSKRICTVHHALRVHYH